MSRPPVAFATGNRGKLEEARRIFAAAGGLETEGVALDLPEIQSLDLEEVLRAKGREAARRLRRPVIVEETGFEIDAFGGFPGPLVKWMLRAMGAEGMARAALAAGAASGAGAGATARCALMFLDAPGAEDGRGAPATSGDAHGQGAGASSGAPEPGEVREVVAEGVARGRLVLPPRGEGGFGWDPVFRPDGEERTFGELSGEEKDRIGHRGRAWRALAAHLAGPTPAPGPGPGRPPGAPGSRRRRRW
ncbi:MAG: non-canonical purine NTP pyrophosphatase [Thermoanaerobaculia bacterium]